MLGMYRQSLAKMKGKKSKADKYTGHDRYHGEKTGLRKRKKGGVLESKSVTDVREDELMDDNPFRAASYDHLQELGGSESDLRPRRSGDRALNLGGKMESLAKLFSCVTVAGDRKDTYSYRQSGGSYAYTALEPNGQSSQERLEMESKASERAYGICAHYLQTAVRYSFVEHLNDIGSRLDKHWFIVRDASVKTERLLTIVPKNPRSPVNCDPEGRSVVLDLFLALHHPYVYPVLDINFREIGDSTYIFTILPLNDKGSLKDFIYRNRWQDNWEKKYCQKSHGLPMSMVQRLGRQILEALLFLKEKGFPPSGHFHTGNIILQNGVARLTGLEDALFGFTSRAHPVLLPRIRSDYEGIDTLCFGHVLFEMCAGYELDTPEPSPANLLDIHQYPQAIEVLEFIFGHPNMKLPAIEELLFCDFFRNIDLREMRNQAQSTQVFKMHITPKGAELMYEVRMETEKRLLLCAEGDAPKEKSTSSPGCSDEEADDGDKDADTSSEAETSSKSEHRCLTLHANAANRLLSSVRKD